MTTIAAALDDGRYNLPSLESFEVEYLATLNPVLEVKERGKVVAVEVARAEIVAKVVRSLSAILP